MYVTAILRMYTMGQILRNWRVILATLFAIVLIAGASALARNIESPSVAQATAETALLQAIATKDSDNDGLPDWEEALYGTSPNIVDTFNLGMTDGDAVASGLIVPKAIADISITASSPDTTVSVDPSLPPVPAEGTLTAAFAQHFFTLYLAAKERSGGANLSPSEMQSVADEALRSLSAILVVAPDFKSAKDITVAGTGADALEAFAVSAEVVSLKNTANATKSEILYLKDALENNDTSALMHIASIAKAYRDSAAGFAVLPVPEELAADVLVLVNSMMRVSEIASDFARVNADPLAAILALQQYLPATQALGNAFIGIGNVYKTAGVVLPSDTPGASFVNLISDITPKP